VEQVGDGYRSAASPAVNRDGDVFFTDPVANRSTSDADAA
jgi:hypothetical protein